MVDLKLIKLISSRGEKTDIYNPQVKDTKMMKYAEKKDDSFYMYMVIPYTFTFLLIGVLIVRRYTNSSLLFDQINYISLAAFIIYIAYARILRIHSAKFFLYCAAITISISMLTGLILLNVDRSRSLYVIGWVHHDLVTIDNGTFDFSKIKSQEKLNEAAIIQRISEHETRNLMFEESNNLKLTFMGNFYYRIANLLSQFFNLTGWQQNSR